MNGNPKKKEQQQSGINAAGTPLSIFEIQREDINAGLSPKESPNSLDYVKTYMESIKENPNFDMDAVVYNMDNINGPYANVKSGLRWAIKMPYEEYQKLYPELTENMFNSLKERYNMWETVYNNGTIGNYAKANASQVDPVTWYLNENNPFRRQTFTIRGTEGPVDPQISAMANNAHIGEDGIRYMGLPVEISQTPNGSPIYTYKMSDVIPDPDKPGKYIFKVLSSNKKEPVQRIAQQPMGSTSFVYTPSYAFNSILKQGGNNYTYKDEKGADVILEDVGYNSEGYLVTSNKFLTNQKNYTDEERLRGLEIKKIMKEHGTNIQGVLNTETTTFKRGKDNITFKKVEQPTYYKETNSFGDYVFHGLGESYFRMGTWLGNVFFDGKSYDNKYYESLLRTYQNPVGVDTSSPFYNRNVANMIGDLAAQLIPSIITGGVSAAIGGSVSIGGKLVMATAKTLANNTGKQGLKRALYLGAKGGLLTYQKPAAKAVLNKYLMNTARTLSWSVPASGQSGYGQYQQGIQSGLNDADATYMSVIMAGITLASSALLEPTYLRKGFYMGMNKSIVNNTIGNLYKEIGLDITMKEGKQRFIKKAMNGIMNNIQRGGVQGWFIGRGIDGLLEGTQEASEQLLGAMSMGLYNRYDKDALNKRIGEGRFDVSAQLDDIGSSFILGGLMGMGVGVVNPLTLTQAIVAKKNKTTENKEYMFYNDFNNIGVDKVVSNAQMSILDDAMKQKLGRFNYDTEGNEMRQDENGNLVGKTINIEGQPLAHLFENGILKTESDVTAYNMITEIAREADIYNTIKSNPIIKDVDSNTLIAVDQKNNIVINAAKAYKALETIQNRKDEIEKRLSEPDTEGKEVLQNELKRINENDIYDKNTLAYAKNEYEKWTKPLDDINRDGIKVSNYRYSQKIRESIINTALTADSYHIINAIKNKFEIDSDIMENPIYGKLIESPEGLFGVIHGYHDIFGEIDAVVQDKKTGKLEYYGLGKFVREWNDKTFGRKYPLETISNIRSILTSVQDMATRKVTDKDFENLLGGLDNELQKIFEMSGDTETFGEMLGMQVDEESDIVKGDITRTLNNILKSIENIDYEGGENLDMDVLEELDRASRVFKGKYESRIQSILEAQKNAGYRNVQIGIDMLDGIYSDGIQGEQEKKAIEAIFKRVLDTINGDMYLASFVNNPSELPLIFRNFTISDLLNFIEENKNNNLDADMMDALSRTMEIASQHMANTNAYLWALENLSISNSESVKQGHTYDNEITKRLLQAKEDINAKQQRDMEAMDVMLLNLRKNGYTREKENTRYMAAQISNNDIYLSTIGRDNGSIFLPKIFHEKNNIFSVDEKAKGLEGTVAKKINDYLDKFPKEQRNDEARRLDENSVEVMNILKEYEEKKKDMLLSFYGPSLKHEDPNLEYEHSINEVSIELERLFTGNSENKEQRITEYKSFMNNLNALQWETRNKLSGKLVLHLLFIEGVAEHNDVKYETLNEHQGKKLYVTSNSTTEESNTIYRGTYSPADMEIGKSALFDETSDIVNMTKDEMINYINNYFLDVDVNLSESEMKDAIIQYNDENKIQRRNNALHLIMTNLTIDNYLGGENLTSNDVFTIISNYTKSRILKEFTEEQRAALSDKIVYDGHRIDIDSTIENIKQYLNNHDDIKLRLEAESIFQVIRKNINIEQEQTVLHMIANYYKNIKGEFYIGMNSSDKDVFKMFNNSICVIGGGGTGKSTMIMENYYNIIKTIMSPEITNKEGKIIPDNRIPRILTISPTYKLNELQEENIVKVFDSVDHKKALFEDVRDINDNYDIIVIDEASMILNKNYDDKDKINRKSFQEMLKRVNPKQVVFLYDTNQTLNTEDVSLNLITSMLGERTIPLQTRYRTGYTDLNSLVEFFTNTDFIEYNENKLPPLIKGGNPIKTRYKEIETPNGSLMQGIKVTDNEKVIIDDYFKMKKQSTNNMIVVRTGMEKERIINAYKVTPEDVFILEYGDPNFNVSGRGSSNVFVLMDYNKVMSEVTSDIRRRFALTMLSKWYNTAITRLQGAGYLAVQYDNDYSLSIKEDDIIPQYNDILNFNNAYSKDDVIGVFEAQARVELKEKNNGLDRTKAIDDRFPKKKIKEQPIAQESITSEHVYEDISKKVKKDIDKIKKEIPNKGAIDITNLIYKDKNIDQYSRNINDLLRKGIENIFQRYIKGILNYEDILSLERFDSIYNDFITSYRKYTKDSGFNIDEFLAENNTESIKDILHNFVLNSISASGLEVIAGLNPNTSIIAPNLNIRIEDEDYISRPLFINAVGYTEENGNTIPVFDIYITDFSRKERSNENDISEGNRKKAIYTVASLASKGYKVNKIHYLNYVLRNTESGINLGYVKDNIRKKEDVISDPDYINIMTSLNQEEAFAPEDTLLKIGVSLPISNNERAARYKNKDGREVYLKAKFARKENGQVNIYYVLNNGNTVSEIDFTRNYTSNFIKEKNRLDRGAVISGSIFSPIRGIPADSIEGELGITREGFYKNGFFTKAKDRILNLKPGDNIQAEYVENMDFYIYNEYSKEPQKVPYKNVVLYKINGEIIGIQERITYGTDDIQNDEIDAMITEYVKGNLDINKIENALSKIEEETERNDFTESNISYQIEKIKNIKMIRDGNTIFKIKEISAGTVIVSNDPPQSITSLKQKLGYDGKVDWRYGTDKMFNLYATMNIDGRKVNIHVDAAKIDKDYINSLREDIRYIKDKYNEMIKEKDFNIGSLREILMDSEIVDFLYANRQRLEMQNLDLISGDFIDLKLDNRNKKQKEIFGRFITQMEIAFELAELSMTGDMRETYNKAIFKTDKQKALSSDSVYEDNLVTQVQDISLPSINVISENISDKNKPIIISKERTIKSKTSRKRNIMESNIDRERVIEILQREGQITCQGITLKVDEFNSMTREEQDNFIKCY